MKYTRVKAVTCAITASAVIFGTAAMQASATGVSYELPAAGIGLTLDEGRFPHKCTRKKQTRAKRLHRLSRPRRNPQR